MTNIEHIVSMRLAGYKPKSVHIHIVHDVDPGNWAVTPKGSVYCEVSDSESLASLDLRPLRGLFVLTHDFTGNRDRHRKLAKMIAAEEPDVLVMNDGETVHRRTAGSPAITESFAL